MCDDEREMQTPVLKTRLQWNVSIFNTLISDKNFNGGPEWQMVAHNDTLPEDFNIPAYLCLRIALLGWLWSQNVTGKAIESKWMEAAQGSGECT